MSGWMKNRFCPKCQGEGWVWAGELYSYPGEPTGCPDDTRYTCDHACHFEETGTVNAETEIARQRLADNYFDAILEVLEVCPTEEPTWESVAKSLGAPADVELVCEAYYTRKANWTIGTKLRAALSR